MVMINNSSKVHYRTIFHSNPTYAPPHINDVWNILYLQVMLVNYDILSSILFSTYCLSVIISKHFPISWYYSLYINFDIFHLFPETWIRFRFIFFLLKLQIHIHWIQERDINQDFFWNKLLNQWNVIYFTTFIETVILYMVFDIHHSNWMTVLTRYDIILILISF